MTFDRSHAELHNVRHNACLAQPDANNVVRRHPQDYVYPAKIPSAYSHLQFKARRDQCLFTSPRRCDSVEETKKGFLSPQGTQRHKDQNPTEADQKQQKTVGKGPSGFLKSIWTVPGFGAQTSVYAATLSGRFSRLKSLGPKHVCDINPLLVQAALSPWQKRSSVLLNKRWPTLEVQMRLEGDRLSSRGAGWARWHYIGYGSGFVFRCGPRGVSAFIQGAYQGSIKLRNTRKTFVRCWFVALPRQRKANISFLC